MSRPNTASKERYDDMEQLNDITSAAVKKLLELGAQKAQACAARTETREFNVEGGEFNLLRTLFDNSLSLTAIKDGKKGSISGNRFDGAAIAEMAADCISSAADGDPDPAWDIAPAENRGSFLVGAPECDLDLFFERLRELVADIKTRHPLIMIEQLIAQHIKEKEVYLNSNGAHFETTSGCYDVSLMFSAHEGEKGSSFFETSVRTAELSKPMIELGSFESDLAAVEKQIDTVPVEGKSTGTMVLAPGCLNEMLEMAIFNFTGDIPMLNGTSIWREKLGQKVADERLTVSRAPFDSRIVFGERHTGEGFASEDFDLIENGVLKSFSLSNYVANKTGLPRAKNSSSCLLVAPGERPLAEIIAGIDNGILVLRFSGGEPGVNGDFSGVAKNSFIIRGGAIAEAVSETMISGNLDQMLRSIRDISCETVENGSSVLPYIAFDGITISGK